MNTPKIVTAVVASIALLASVAAVSSSANGAPTAAAPADVRYPAGFASRIFVGNVLVYTPPVTVPPTTAAPTTAAPTTVPRTTIAPTTAAPTTAAPTTAAPTTAAPRSGGAACGLASAAFCETFDAAHNGGTQTGDLDKVLWGVSRLADINPSSAVNGFVYAHNPCGGGALSSIPADVRVCNGQMVEAQNDGGAITNLDTYPKQPFNFAGRTGTVVFDVSADSDGTHAAWPEFLITDKPVPGVRRCISECNLGADGTPTAPNQIGFSIAGGTGGPGGVTGVDTFFASVNGVYSDIAPTQYGTVTKGSSSAMNHFEVNVSQTRIDVYGTNAGSKTLVHLAGAAINLAFSQGLVWLNDVHYNARKAIEPCACGTQYDHSFAWDNLGFDGPKTYRDVGYDVPYANVAGGPSNQNGDPEAVQEGYQIGTARTLSVTGVALGTATGAQVVLNAYTFSGTGTMSVSVNGHTAVAHAFSSGFHWQSFTIPIPVAQVVAGTNTLAFTSNDGSTTVTNVTLIMVAAAPVP